MPSSVAFAGVGFEIVSSRPNLSCKRHNCNNLYRRRYSSPLTCARPPYACAEHPKDESSPNDSKPQQSPSVVGFAIGLAGSTLGSLIGAGGGVALTPLLTSILRLPQARAHGTALCVVVVTAAVGAAKYTAAGQMSVPAAFYLAATAVICAPFGARAAARADGARLKLYFGMFLCAISVLIPTLPRVLEHTPGLLLSLWTQRAVLLGVGTVTGFLSGLLGIGGGTVAVPALVLLTALPQKASQGTALLAMVLPSIIGAVTHFRLGNVVVPLLPGLVAGAIGGGYLGSSLALYLPETTLRLVCSTLFALIGFRYCFVSIAGLRKP